MLHFCELTRTGFFVVTGFVEVFEGREGVHETVEDLVDKDAVGNDFAGGVLDLLGDNDELLLVAVDHVARVVFEGGYDLVLVVGVDAKRYSRLKLINLIAVIL